MSASRPNLLFLFSDQHTQRIAGCYGGVPDVTPNLDRLAAQGVAFDNAYCPSPLCVPSRMSMLTQRHPYEQECWTNDDFLSSDAATWPHALGAAHYRPVLAGRLHAMGPDQLHGYAERLVGDHSPNWPGVPRHDMGVLDKANDPWRESLERSGIGQSAYQVKDIETAAAACAYLRDVGKARRGGDDAPFCLSVGFLLPHPPYVAWREDYERFAGRVPPPAHGEPPTPPHAWEAWWRDNRGLANVDPQSAQRARTAYHGLVYRLDALVGQLLTCLESEVLDDDTLVVYTTDHGDHLGERGLWWKHTLYDPSVKVPLVMRWPGALPGGQRRAQVCNLVDVAATMLMRSARPRCRTATVAACWRSHAIQRHRGPTRRSPSTAPTAFPRGRAGATCSSACSAAAAGSSSITTATPRSCSTWRPILTSAGPRAIVRAHGAARRIAREGTQRLESRRHRRAHSRAAIGQADHRGMGAQRAPRRCIPLEPAAGAQPAGADGRVAFWCECL
jgi:arylsulfatase A-like enzyme